MSHNYPYRQAPTDSDLRSDPRHYSSAASADFYRRPQESFPSSSRGSAAPQPAQSPQDSVLSLLSSCGLEPGDLAVLAKLPEDVLTVESLPHLIKQIKGKKGTVKPFTPRPPSPPPPSSSRSFSSTHRPSTSSSSLDWDQLRRQPVQYPLHVIPPSAPRSETRSDQWGAHSSVRSSSSSVRPMQDTDLRPRLSDYGKAASSCSSVELKRTRPSRFSDAGTSDYRSVPDERRRRSRSSSASLPVADQVPIPSKQQALDFHGSLPSVYPYSCSLCDITVLSEKVWLDHINGTVHADGQLKLLQQFTNWDCRVKHSNRDEDQSHRRRAGPSSAPSTQRANQNQEATQTNKKLTKPSDRGRVVCVKFPAQSVDEAYLQECIKPFGKMGKILMFPSVAFVELGTADQAKDLVKFYSNLDPAENKRQLDFSISNTFSFLQSSQVVSFTPAPSGRDGRSDLISVIKRFGEPLYSLFLPSKAFIEMKLPADAKKLVDYYSSNVLKINNDSISVSFSTEYKSLMRVSLATRCDEEPNETTTSSTREPSSERRTRSRSRDRFRLTGRPRIRSRSRERSKGRSSHGSRSRDRSRREERTRTRSRSSEENKDNSSKDTKSKSEERSSNGSTEQNQTKEEIEEPKKPEEPEGSEKTEEPEEPGTETRSAAEPEDDPGPDAADEEQVDDEHRFSADDSDIEGMEVIAEDGEKLKDEDAKSQKEEESQEETNRPEETADSPEGDEYEVKSMELDDQGEEEEREEAADTEDDEESGFPVDLENCITLDEVDCEDEGEADQGDGSESSESSRVLFFNTMPEVYTDMEFIQVMRGLGTVVRYLLMNDRQQGFIEMLTPSEAQEAVEVLESEFVHINGTRLMGCLSQEYSRLTDGWAVPSDEEEETSEDKGQGARKSERLNKSSTDQTPELETSEKTWDQRMTSKKILDKDASEMTPELETSETFQEKNTNETPELETSETFQEKNTDETPELETSETFQEKNTDETPELETSETFQEKNTDDTSENTLVRRTRSKKIPQLTTSDRKTRSKKIPEKDSSEKTQEMETDKTPETKMSEEIQENKTNETLETKMSIKTSDRRTRSKPIPDKENSDKASHRKTRSKMTPEETEMPENVSEMSPDTKTSVEETPETEVSKKIPETDSSSKTSEEELRTTSEKELTGRKTVRGKTSPRKGPETRTDKRKGSPEYDAVPLKTIKTEPEPLEDTNQRKDGTEPSTGESLETKTSKPEVKESNNLDHPEPPEQDAEMEQQPAPAEGATGPEKPSKPVGPEFVRPVVGYFCNLCQLIFIDEDEAKLQHCSTPEHYRKYQEKTGKDPWSS